MTPQLVMLAGPNGAGKSTFRELFLADSPLPFLNADLVAAELDIDSLEAARLLDATRARLVADGLGFITETVFSDPYGEKLGLLRDAMSAGYEVILLFVCVANPRLSQYRVAQRVAHGGHDVPAERIASRYKRSLANLRAALPIVSLAKLYDNSSVDEPYRLIATFESGQLTHRAPGRLPAWTRGIVPARR